MAYFIEGILLGLFLAISLGPIFVTLTQASMEKGLFAGFAVGFGVWISDIIILAFSIVFIGRISSVVNGEQFQFWMGISGAIILAIFGIILLLKTPQFNKTTEMLSIKGFAEFWMKGFLINTINPFTFIFWLGVLSTYMIGRDISKNNLTILLGSIMIMIIASDSFKVVLAKLIRDKLKINHIVIISRISGIGLIIFAIVMAYKVM